MKKTLLTLFLLFGLHCQAALLDLNALHQLPEMAQLGTVDLERLAGQGNTQAQATLGLQYLHPVMRQLDLRDLSSARQSARSLQRSEHLRNEINQGLHWMGLAAEHEQPAAQLVMGLCQLVGLGDAVDSSKAWDWIRKAAAQGFAEAEYLLGVAYLTGEDGMEENLLAGLYHLDQAAQHGHAEAKRIADRALQFIMEQPPITRAKAFSNAVQAAQSGDTNAQYELAERYAEGRGTELDNQLALHWYQHAAEGGHLEAMLQAAKRYAQGVGAPENDEQAMHWLGIAKARNPTRTGYSMLAIGRDGAAKRRNADWVYRWIVRAAELGNPSAEAELGWKHFYGNGAVQDYALAASWYTKSAAHGFASSQYRLAKMYDSGTGVQANMETAYFWWYLSSLQNYIGGELNSEGYWDKLPADRQNQLRNDALAWQVKR